MRPYFAYIRVSTARQGEHGASLPEQRDAVSTFATRNGLEIVEWFEERETAAHTGRKEFTRMLSALKNRKANGVIFHKIDRSTRNLKDWSTIQDLADQGIDVRFAHESVNLGSNEGKLTGDFLAVISAHYIRNLREEVKKGIRGRLKQGLFPQHAPIGYLNQGGGKPKVPDPVRAPFVRQAFELYASGKFALRDLADQLHARGLRGRAGNRVDINRLAELLRNPFYAGVIRMKCSGETYPGIHEPLISTELFGRVQKALDGKMNVQVKAHDFLFRRMIVCFQCKYHLIGERQKGNIYFRCHNCRGQSIREEAVQTAIGVHLIRLSLTVDETEELRDMALALRADGAKCCEEQLRSVALQLCQVKGRLGRLMDAYLDNAIDRPLFEEKRMTLLLEQKSLEEQHYRISAGEDLAVHGMEEYLEPLKTLSLSYEKGSTEERRHLLKIITSNLWLDRKRVVVELKSPFREIANLNPVRSGSPVRDRPRTFMKKVFALLVQYATTQVKERQRQAPLDLAA